MLEKLSELVEDARWHGIGFKNKVPNLAPEFDAEGRLLEEDNLRGGAEALCAHLERPSLVLPTRREDISANPQRAAKEGESRVISMHLQRTRPAPFPLLRPDTGSQSRGQSHHSERCERSSSLLPPSQASSPQSLAH